MKLLIVESPGKIKTLKKYLGPEWEVAASLGHIRDLPQKEIGVEPPNFIPAYELNDKGKTTVPKLKALAAKCDEVYLATDPDREGEAISWHLKQVLNLKNPKRVRFGSITKPVVLKAVAEASTIDMPMVSAQEARRTLDRLVGYMVSPALSSAAGYSGLSAGRVQTPAVRIGVEREELIRNFVEVKHFGVTLGFDDTWKAEWLSKRLLEKDQEHWTDEKFAVEVSKLRKVKVESFTEGEASKAPPAPFTTSTLQQAASAALSMDPEVTMRNAQKLYEAGHITYMRTDNPNLSHDALMELKAFAESKNIALVHKFRNWKAKDGAQEAHEAIRPAHFEVVNAGEDAEQQKLYTLIRNRAIASQMEDARYATRSAIMVALETVQANPIHFEAKGRTLIHSGWLSLTKGDQTDEDTEAEPDNPVPNLVSGQVLTANKGTLNKKVTKPPPRFTQAGLIKELEARGIGRPATYAAIMANIKAKGYFQQQKKMLVPTDTAFLVVKALVGNFQFIEFPFTKNMEVELDEIAQGKSTYKAVVSKIYDTLSEELQSLKKNVKPAHPCPSCGAALRRIKGPSGFFWGCSNYSNTEAPCKVSLPDIGGKPGAKGDVDPKAKPVSKSGTKGGAAASKYKCTCGKPLAHKVKEGAGGYNFWGCTGFPACKKSYKDVNGKPNVS